jgi:hypothetical protein
MEQEGNQDVGSLEVRFFNQLTNHVIADAVYVTLGCGEEVGSDLERCADAKLAEVACKSA